MDDGESRCTNNHNKQSKSLMEYYYEEDVFSAAKRRIEWIFDNFPHIVIGFSGGKDSTVVLQLALMVAEQKNRLPLEVFFIDQ